MCILIFKKMNPEIVRLIIIFIPVFSALTTFCVLCFEFFNIKNQKPQSIKILMYYFTCILISFTSIYFYYYHPIIFVYTNSLVMLAFVLIQILFYQFVFEITKLDKEEKFSLYHYVLPIAIFCVFVYFGLTTPLNEQIEIIKAKGDCTDNSYLFCKISNSKFPIRFIITITYTVLCFKRLIYYRKNIGDYSANYEKSSLRWVRVYLFLSLALIPIPFLGTLISRDDLSSSYLMLFHVVILLVQYSYISYNTIKENYIIQREEKIIENSKAVNPLLNFENTDEQNDNEKSDSAILKKQLLNKEIIENIVIQHKLYLNSNLKITDLATYLNTNRSYLSSFINKEYCMNFSKFINQYRLSEYTKLKSDKIYSNFTDKELAEMSGFGSYKNFLRFINNE